MIRSPVVRPSVALAILGCALAAVAGSPPATAAEPAACRGVDGRAAALNGRRVFLLDAADLAEAAAERAGTVARAEAALKRPLASVMDKRSIPPSDDRHDYISLAPYWWPDPANPKAPWVRRDGEVNPARATTKFDREALGRMVSDVDALARGYAVSGDRRYADRAAAAVRAWFLDPATAMNPNFTFAQMVPGRSNGRPEGVLDGSGFQRVIDAVGLIGPAGSLSAAETAALESWFGRLVDWLLKHPNGRQERAAENNHGVWFDSQLMHFALFARRPDVASTVAKGFPARLAKQIAPDGGLPGELTRTRSFHYSLFALEPAYNVAVLATCVDRDIWGWSDGRGRSLQRATDFVAAYRGRPANWPYRESSWPAAALDRLLTRANRVWPGRYTVTAQP